MRTKIQSGREGREKKEKVNELITEHKKGEWKCTRCGRERGRERDQGRSGWLMQRKTGEANERTGWKEEWKTEKGVNGQWKIDNRGTETYRK